MAWLDNRESMQVLRTSGDFVVIDDTVSWDLEPGALRCHGTEQ